MMYVWQNSIVDSTGLIQFGARVEVRDATTLALVDIFADENGDVEIENPLTADDGFARFYAPAGQYQVRAFTDQFERFYEDVLLGIPFANLPDITGLVTTIVNESIDPFIAEVDALLAAIPTIIRFSMLGTGAVLAGQGNIPAEWQVTRLSAGNYRVLHGQNTEDYNVKLTVYDPSGDRVYSAMMVSLGENSFDFRVRSIHDEASISDSRVEVEITFPSVQDMQGDPFWDDVVLLLNTNNGALEELTGIPTSVVVTGDGAISSLQAKFGTTSFLNPGTTTESTDYVNCIAPSNTYTFTGEFTWEAWFFARAFNGGFENFFANAINFPAAGFIQLARDPSFSLGGYLFNTSAGGFATPVGFVIPTGQWFHVAVTRNASNVVRLWHNGIQRNTDVTIAGTMGADSGGVSTFEVGRGHASDNSDIDAYFDQVRLTKNRCRYTATFTPPTEPFPNF